MVAAVAVAVAVVLDKADTVVVAVERVFAVQHSSGSSDSQQTETQTEP